MSRWAICLTLLLSSYANAQQAKAVHVEGEQAQELISLLVSGNADVRQAVKDGGATVLTIHDLQLEREATFKYESDHPYYGLNVVHAWGKIEHEDNMSVFGEAISLYNLLSNLNLNVDTTMSGSDIAVKKLRCTIQPELAIDAPARFACDLEQPH